MRNLKNIECFKIRLLQFEKGIFNIENGKTILDVKCLCDYWKLNPTIIVADPFLFTYNDKLYLFYEEKKLKSNGVIKMVYTSDLKVWSMPVIVLEESFHLSFPFVFKDNNAVYLIPESGTDGSVRLYQASNEDLTEFRFKKKLIVEQSDRKVLVGYGDSCIYKKDNLYYLFTMIQYEDGINTLELYYSDKLAGDYIIHPKSPIVISQKTGRNAGSLLYIDGKLFRFSQDCTFRYGENVNISEIIELSHSNYEERIIKENIYPKHSTFYKNGGHQFNAIEFQGKWIVATDAKEYKFLLPQRIINLLLKYFNI